jgi:hypothetical protein
MRVGARWILILAAATTPAVAQRIDPERPATLIVGRSRATSPAERVDGARRGLSPTPLPEGPLRVTWRRSVAPSIEHAPLVTEGGNLVVFTGRGDVLELDPNGTERRRVAVGVGPLGPGAILADGTIVTMTTAGEAVGIQHGHVRFRRRIGDHGVLVKVAPLALDDGGVIVAGGSGATGTPGPSDLAALDADGVVRARATIPAPVAWPLVATKAGVACITADGFVFSWKPGQNPTLAGSFGGALDGGAAALDPGTLVAVVDARRLVALDLDHADARVLATSAAGMLLGPPSAGASEVYVMEVAPAVTRVLAVDASGALTAFSLGVGPMSTDADGGVGHARLPVHTATLVDGSGRVAFAGPDGHVGVVSAGGMTDLGETVCGRGAPPLGASPTVPRPQPGGGLRPVVATRPSAGFAGLAPTAPNTFVVACEAGLLLEIQGG